ncbi:SPOR domain-containing protein [Rhodobacter maris]|uniref:Sporulation related protein n=1 Tax=Rhodobacter maris TaxID=446682 RepID=A0A285SAT5_9RHOB|nr:SPOR domain-containing protein [Rhodobacter maris]SOC04760.1 sporulation related protein [Rhodobacter maris]
MSYSIRWIWAVAAVAALAGCQEGTQPFGFLKGAPKEESGAVPEATSARIVERDVEAPEVFSAEEAALWDGRPSLGGVWVAHPGVKDPERVIIRNPANGKFVIGALFRRERDNPGPKLQVSSDAAAALDVLAGAPTKLSVVALRREETPEDPAATEPAAPEGRLPAAETIAAAPLAAPSEPGTPPKPAHDIAASAGAAIAAAEASPPAQPAPKPAPAKPAAGSKMFVQIGIFSTEANAQRASEQLSKAGVIATIRTEKSQGKTFWSVVAGPAASRGDRDALIRKIKSVGYADAYPVSK